TVFGNCVWDAFGMFYAFGGTEPVTIATNCFRSAQPFSIRIQPTAQAAAKGAADATAAAADELAKQTAGVDVVAWAGHSENGTAAGAAVVSPVFAFLKPFSEWYADLIVT